MWRDSLALVGQRVVSQFLTLYELRKQRVPVNIKPLKNFLSIEILKNTKGTCFHRIIVYNLFHFRFHYSEPIRKFISIYPSKFLKYQRNVFASMLHIYTHTHTNGNRWRRRIEIPLSLRGQKMERVSSALS